MTSNLLWVGNRYCQKTQQAFFYSFVLNAPFYAMYSFLPFVLYQYYQASPFQITLLVTLKPVTSLLSVLWSRAVTNRPDRLVPHVIVSTCLSHAGFLLLPFFHSSWFLIAAATVYMLMERGAKPAWVEILKQRLDVQERQSLFSFVSTISHLASGLLCFLFGRWMDLDVQAFRYLYPLASLLPLTAIFFQWQIPIKGRRRRKADLDNTPTSSRAKPWQQRDFLYFQTVFFLGGSGIMIMQPSLPEYFLHRLEMSYTELALALSLCKGIGYALTSRQWAQRLNTQTLFGMIGHVTLIMALVCVCLLLAQIHSIWVYIAYCVYGAMQAGSEMSWHLAGPLFSGSQDSSPYTSLSVILVGVRGLFAPTLGLYCIHFFGITSPLFLTAIFCLIATYIGYRAQKIYAGKISYV